MVTGQLIASALQAEPLAGRPWRVLAKYTHLVVGCALPGGRSLVLKFWRNNRKQSVDTYLHRRLAAILPVPRVVATGFVRATTDAVLTPRFWVERGELIPYTAYEALAGTAPAATFLRRWPAEVRRHAYRQAGRWLRIMHDAVPFERCGRLLSYPDGWQGSSEGWFEFARDQLELAERQVQRFNVPRADRRLRRRLQERLERVLPEIVHTERYTLCHRDYSFRNLLARPDGTLTGIIDFEHAIAGDPIFDLHRFAACLWPQQTAQARADWQALVEGYGGLRPEEERRLLRYVAMYALTSFGYALKEQDAGYYQECLALMAWLLERSGL